MARKDREKRFIAEYMVETFPEGNFVLNVPLGNVPVELIQLRGLTGAAKLFRPSRRRVDAVAWNPQRYLLIESKIRDPMEGLNWLLLYLEEARETPDLPGFTGQPIIGRLVVPFAIDRDRRAATRQQVELVVFPQQWIEEYLLERQKYFTKEFRAIRNERERMRQLLGLE